ncbi:MAG: nitroreductase family protein [Oscillospiraceae bacterium]
MNILEAIENRHSVRSYLDKPIENDIIEQLHKEVKRCNQESGLNIQLLTNEPNAFSGFMAHYGKFNNVKNYIALVGSKSQTLEEKIGYYGERLVLKSQTLGLNSCWVALTFNKGKCKAKINNNEHLVCVIALGYGATQGIAHNSKPIESLYQASDIVPDWFKSGMKSVALAPTAMNQQKFLFTLNSDGTVSAKSIGGFYSKVDLGIVKYHFEIGAEIDNFKWK